MQYRDILDHIITTFNSMGKLPVDRYISSLWRYVCRLYCFQLAYAFNEVSPDLICVILRVDTAHCLCCMGDKVINVVHVGSKFVQELDFHSSDFVVPFRYFFSYLECLFLVKSSPVANPNGDVNIDTTFKYISLYWRYLNNNSNSPRGSFWW